MGGRSGISWGAVARSLVMLAFSRSAAALGWPGAWGQPPGNHAFVQSQDRRRLLSADLLA
jgi:hypothetical protein